MKDIIKNILGKGSKNKVSENALKSPNQKDLIKITEQQTYLYKVDIQTWRNAIEEAINIHHPRYEDLIDVYKDVSKDAFLKGKMQTRSLNVLNTPFEVVDSKTKEKDDALSNLLNKQWFYKYLGLVIDSIFWGYSVIELQIDRTGLVQDTKLLPRQNCIPQWKAVLPDLHGNDLVFIEKEPYRNLYIQVGEADGEYNDIGLLDTVAAWTILKKHSRAFWSQFQELFGMPYRYAEYGGKDDSVKDAIYENLSKMGAAGFGVFPTGVKLELKEASKTDSFQIFLNAITQANEEISQAILGVPASQSHEGSYARDKVSYEKESDISYADIRFATFHINDQLLPRLNKWGYNFKGKEFVFNPTWSLPIANTQLEVDTWLSQDFDLDEEYIKNTYGTEVTKKPNAPL